MLTSQKKSENDKYKQTLRNTMQFKEAHYEEESELEDLYSNQNRAKLREGLLQREKEINYSYIPNSVKKRGEESGLSIENVSSMHHAGKTAQLQALDRAKNANFLFSIENNERGTIQQKKENKTGILDNLKAGVESQSGISMDDVRVHYNSDKPKGVGALAYTQGTEIHVGPGQEKHLEHELGHVVQQKQGRVRPTTKINGININDDIGLEREADVIGKLDNNLKSTAQRKLNSLDNNQEPQSKINIFEERFNTGLIPIQRMKTGRTVVLNGEEKKWLKKDFQTDAVRENLENNAINIRGEIQNFPTKNHERVAELRLLNDNLKVNLKPKNLEAALEDVTGALQIAHKSGKVNGFTADQLFTRIEKIAEPGILLGHDLEYLKAEYRSRYSDLRNYFSPIIAGIIGDDALDELITKPVELIKLKEFSKRIETNVGKEIEAKPTKKDSQSKDEYISIVDTNVAASITKGKNKIGEMSELEKLADKKFTDEAGGSMPTLTAVGVGEFREDDKKTVGEQGFNVLKVDPQIRNGAKYKSIYKTLRDNGVGADKGVMDSSIVADVFISSTDKHKTEFFTGDADVIVGLGKIAKLKYAQDKIEDIYGKPQSVKVPNKAKMINQHQKGQFSVTLEGYIIIVKTIAEALKPEMAKKFGF